MSRLKSRLRPTVEVCEDRALLSGFAPTPASASFATAVHPAAAEAAGQLEARTLRGKLSTRGGGQVTLATLQAFTKAYLTTSHDPLYNPSLDVNHNGQIGMGDGKLLLHEETPLTPKVPLNVTLALAPGQQAGHTLQKNSGGITYREKVTIVGKTTPGSLIFSDSSAGDYSFTGPATTTDSQGHFSFKVTLKSGINNNNFLVIDPFGQQVIRDYPIRWLGFGQNGT